MPKGLLFASFDFSTAHADEFHDWYDLEHIPERLRVPGFINAERWIGAENPSVAVATYDLDSLGVLHSPPYEAIGYANSSVWTKRVTAKAKRLLRFTGDQLKPGDVAAPAGAGGLLVVSMNVDPAAEHEFNEWYNTEHLPQLAAVPGVLCARRIQLTGSRPGTPVPRDVSPDQPGRIELRRVEESRRHPMDRAFAPALPRPAADPLQALRASLGHIPSARRTRSR